jgi:hypothetical protein
LYYYNYWHDVRGFFTDNDGNQVWEVGFGWYFVSDSTVNYNSQALSMGDYTSGVWIDDVVVKAESLAETPIWTETQTFEGPFEPCENIHVQFEWEDFLTPTTGSLLMRPLRVLAVTLDLNH